MMASVCESELDMLVFSTIPPSIGLDSTAAVNYLAMSDSDSDEESSYLMAIHHFVEEEKLYGSRFESETSSASSEDSESDSSIGSSVKIKSVRKTEEDSCDDRQTDSSSPVSRANRIFRKSRVLEDSNTSDTDSSLGGDADVKRESKRVRKVPRILCRISLKSINLSVILAPKSSDSILSSGGNSELNLGSLSVGAKSVHLSEETDEENYVLDEENVLRLFTGANSALQNSEDDIPSESPCLDMSRNHPSLADASKNISSSPLERKPSSSTEFPPVKSKCGPLSKTKIAKTGLKHRTSTSPKPDTKSTLSPASKPSPPFVPKMGKDVAESALSAASTARPKKRNKPGLSAGKLPSRLPSHPVKPAKATAKENKLTCLPIPVAPWTKSSLWSLDSQRGSAVLAPIHKKTSSMTITSNSTPPSVTPKVEPHRSPLGQRRSPSIPQQLSSVTNSTELSPRVSPSYLANQPIALSGETPNATRQDNDHPLPSTRVSPVPPHRGDGDRPSSPKRHLEQRPKRKISIAEYTGNASIQPICVIDWNHSSVPTLHPPKALSGRFHDTTSVFCGKPDELCRSPQRSLPDRFEMFVMPAMNLPGDVLSEIDHAVNQNR